MKFRKITTETPSPYWSISTPLIGFSVCLKVKGKFFLRLGFNIWKWFFDLEWDYRDPVDPNPGLTPEQAKRELKKLLSESKHVIKINENTFQIP